MSATEFLADLIRRLESRDLRYALVGSIATMAYGEPRATLDVDVVVALQASDADTIEGLFPPPDHYLSPGAMAEAIRSRSQFNVIHPGSGMKADFFVAGDAIERSQLDHRLRRAILPGVEAWCSRPEELIVKKLDYYSQGQSDKHLRDVASMLRISPGQIDLERVGAMVAREELVELWEQVLEGVRADEA